MGEHEALDDPDSVHLVGCSIGRANDIYACSDSIWVQLDSVDAGGATGLFMRVDIIDGHLLIAVSALDSIQTCAT